MYEKYFGLNRPPFKITPDTSLFYSGGERGDILGALVYAVHRGEGIVKVVGEVGSGKTMLCRMLQQELPKSVEIIYIANPSVSAEDILFVIAHELELAIPNKTSKHEVMHRLQEYLVQKHVENKQVVLFIEEAQGMPLSTLEEIRLLSNLETGQNKLLQIILFGQPELDENLAKKSIRQLRERITHSFSLSPLSTDEVYFYLNFRMREVGYTGPELINRKIAKKIQRYSGGLLRQINIITDKILLSAFADSTHNITNKQVLAAVSDSDLKREGSGNNKWVIGALLVTIALAIGHHQFEEEWLVFILGKTAINPMVQNEKLVQAGKNKLSNQNNLYLAKPEIIETKKTISDREDSNRVSAQVETIESSKIKSVVKKSQENREALGSDSLYKVINSVELVSKIKQSKEILLNDANRDLELVKEYDQWIDEKKRSSLEWLANANKEGVTIQVMMLNQSKGEELVHFLQNDWSLDLDQTHLYEFQSTSRHVYFVFYGEFDSVSNGSKELKKLPMEVRANNPYLHSIYKMQAALLNE
jgi:MSHA biogenesis protein MshM